MAWPLSVRATRQSSCASSLLPSSLTPAAPASTCGVASYCIIQYLGLPGTCSQSRTSLSSLADARKRLSGENRTQLTLPALDSMSRVGDDE